MPPWLPATFLLAALAPGSSSTAAITTPTDQSAVQEEFRQLCRDLANSEHPQYGHARLRTLRSQLDGIASTGEEPAPVQALLGVELLKLGRGEDSIRELTTALDGALARELDNRVTDFAARFLALAHLQRAEDLNCLEGHVGSSCILPFTGEAIHSRPEHARRAATLLAAYLERRPDDWTARWLLNVARLVSGDGLDGVPERYRLPEDALAPEVSFARWRNLAPELGLVVSDLAGGAIMDDFDGDGLLDLVTSTIDPCDSVKAWRNDGRGGFEDVTRTWQLDRQLGGLNLIHGDYDGDGDLDLFLLRGAWQFHFGRIRNSLLRNDAVDGGRRFVDVTAAAGLAEPALPTQTAAWADYDGDGDLDLYIGNEANEEDAYASQLMRNRGDGTFEDVTVASGVANLRYAKAVVWGDYDNDGDPDLFVSNIGDNRLYRNDGDSRFRDVAPELGVTGPFRSFTSWFFDYDNDGDLDLFVADYAGPLAAVAASYFGETSSSGQPVLYRNDGGGFRAMTGEAGLDRPLLPMGANFGDLDNDGWLDLYLGTGDPSFESLVPDAVYRNLAGGRFQEVTFAGGFGHLQKGHGVAFGDLDNDGDQDVFHQLGGFYPGDDFRNAVFENPTRGAHWLVLRLMGRRANRFGVGARIEVVVASAAATRRSIHLEAGSGGSFGGSSLQVEVGLGDAVAVESTTIRWPGSGTIDVHQSLARDRIYVLEEGAGAAVPVNASPIALAGGARAAAAAAPAAHSPASTPNAP